ncbi:MAG TPA: hypothetical protein VK796_01745 [Cytophaga sp.]|jgi:hypothetical protein|nr:hypothetical protein [Cytophaga sp.]
MKRFKRIVRLAGLFLMVLLASIGMALGLIVPIPQNRRKTDLIEISAEEDVSDKEEPEHTQFKDQQ